MTNISRRKFVQLGTLASASLFVPRFLKGFEQKTVLPATGKIMVVVQLTGGNDSLNTVIPYRNDIYYKSRQKIAIEKEKVITLTDEIGLHPSLKGMKQMYDSGKLSIINGVGYPQPNRSHFRSMDIWQTAGDANELLATGWIGRLLDNIDADKRKHGTFAIEADDTLSLALKGDETKALAIRDINQFRKATNTAYFRQLVSHEAEHSERLAGYLYQTLRESTSAADYLYEQSKIYKTIKTYPDTAIGKRLKTIAGLIGANTATQIYYLSHGGYDTHVNQADRQAKLLKDLDEALTCFFADLKDCNKDNEVLAFTFSEFGRRVAENASNGTDHGTAGSMFVIGNSLKKAGIYNNIPNLADLDEGDLKHTTDFRKVYATVLEKWMSADSKAVLNRKFDTMDFL
jgi:uncharacterized protein (DUF1501 family)